MTILTLRAILSPDGGGFEIGDDPPAANYPVLVLVIRSEDATTPRVVGQHIMTEADAGMVKSGIDLWNQIPALSDRVRFRWEGWTPAAAPLPLGKIGKVLKMFGIQVNQVDAPPAIGAGQGGAP